MASFHLEVGAGGLATLVFDAPDRKVNVFDRAVLGELEPLVAGLGRRNDIAVLVLLSGKPNGFIAGADVELIAGVTDPAEAAAGIRLGQGLFAAWAALPYPTVAAISGACMGGGTEWALASTWRVADDRPETRIGLPEVRLGILPAWGGCTRLPRVIGTPAALDLILAGKSLEGKRALRAGLIDALLPAAGFHARVRDFAAALPGRPRPPLPRKTARGAREALLAGNPLGRAFLFSRAAAATRAATGGHYPAPLAALRAIRAGRARGARAGFAAEERLGAELAVSPIAKNLIHVFRLTERGRRAAGAADSHKIELAAVIGAGAMGGGIAHLLADAGGVPVRMKDLDAGALARGLAHAAGLLRRQVSRRRLTEAEARTRLARIHPTLDDSGLAGADLVIEAVVEKLAVKQKVFAGLAALVGPEAILASNTSSLSIDAIAGDVPHPERVVGLHFFNPVDRMPLVEVIAGRRTAPEVAAAASALARRLGKTPVTVADRPGFLVNRLLGFYSLEAHHVLAEGHRIEEVDRAMTAWGMPMGPLALADEVGVDVAVEVAKILAAAFGDRLPLPAALDRPVAAGRLGKKSGSGFYVWQDGKRKGPDAASYAVLGVSPRASSTPPAALARRMVLPMILEAARCLDEGIVAGAADLDLAMIFGTGFPPFRGGPCRWADSEGLGNLIAEAEKLAETVGPRFRPSEALRGAAQAGGFYARWPA